MLAIGGELRQPINAVVETIEKLKENFEKVPNFNQILHPAYQNCYLISNFISGILDLSRLGAGTFRLVPMESDLKTLVEHLISTLKPRSPAKLVELTFSLSKKLPKLIFTDPMRLMQLLFVLLRSSLKLTEKGFVKLMISEYYAENELFFLFEVKDSSQILYSQKMVASLNSQETDFPSIELSLAKKLVQELGVPERNTLVIASQKNVGNHFKFYISNRRNANTDYMENLEDGMLESNYIEKKNRNVETHKDTISSDKESKSSKSGQRLAPKKETLLSFVPFKAALNHHYCPCAKILIVFSDFLNLLLLQNIFLNLGYLADFCADFAAAKKRLEERRNFPACGKYCSRYELVLIDGDAENEKNESLKDENVKIIAFLDNEAKGKEGSKKIGAVDVLSKNFNQEEIRLLLDKHFEKKSLLF